jgi:hypothetical protein
VGGLCELIVHPVKDILLVSFGVEDNEFGRIKEAPGIQPVSFNKIAPVLAAVAKVNTSRR